MQSMFMVLTTTPDETTARAIAQFLVEGRLAACVNLLPAAQSIYRWQGQIEEASEVILLIKTAQARYAQLEAAIKSVHPYEVPEIVALRVADGLPAYLNWVEAEVKKDDDV